MYELTVEATFAAAHNLREYQGECERLHGHNWRVEVCVAAEGLDRLGMVMDFRDLKAALDGVLQELDHTYLNDVPPFDKSNPTTENLCRHIAARLAAGLPCNVSVRRVSCWESDKCGASYMPGCRAVDSGPDRQRKSGVSVPGDAEEVICEECKKVRATVHLTEVVAGRTVLQHYCADCYARKRPTWSPTD